MKKVTLGSLLCLSLTSLSVSGQQYLIPKPKKVSVGKEKFAFSKLNISSQDTSAEASYLKKEWLSAGGKKLAETNKKATVKLVIDPMWKDNEEAYKLQVNETGVDITAGSRHGLFNGIQTLLQLQEEHQGNKKLPYLQINDAPAFAYRGMHLDVSRHFFSVDEVKRFLDYIASYKMNKFHWHLTDDQGWRIEIKSHPKLTQVAAYRKRLPFDGKEKPLADTGLYGGFYTQEQIKDVVAYASKLHIEVIPEIEMPGHAQAALAAYPELSCTGGPFSVGTQWGVMEDIFCPKEETFDLLEDVIDEVITLFPSQYIHIGGDEAPKTRWKTCPHCQELIKREGLKDEHQLQSYFITRMEKYINAKGKKIIGWDEILEGGLAPNATVMSWTGIEGGIHAAKAGHDAIMTPASHLYFDYYQGNPQTEPVAFSADLRLERVYSYQPIPEALTAEESKHILGAQATMWTEYIPHFKQVEYMLFPRLMALSEVAWGTSQPAEYKAFENRVINRFKQLDREGINYSKAIYEVVGKVSQTDAGLSYRLSTAKDSSNIRYTLDGSVPVAKSLQYKGPIQIPGAVVVKAAYFENGKKISTTSEQVFVHSKSTKKAISLVNKPEDAYAKGGAAILVDGILGSKAFHKEHWLGFIKQDAIAIIDLGETSSFSTVGVSMLENRGIGVHYPSEVSVLSSDDNQSFKPLKTVSVEEIRKANGFVKIAVGEQRARFIKVIMKDPGKIPAGSPLAGTDCWIFTDEITVD